MHRNNTFPVLSVTLFLLLLISSACSTFAPPVPTETPKPTSTPANTTTPTKTPKPTSTPRPTITPDLAATQQRANYEAEAKSYHDLGYISAADGRFTSYDDFKEEWAQLHWYQWWTFDDTVSDFFMSAHVKWSSAYRNADVSGCGFVFAIQENGDHYAVFLDRATIRFLSADQSTYTRRVGLTRGTGRVHFNNPADQPVQANFTIIVKDAYVYVLVDGEVVGEYTLSQSRILRGKLGLSLLSGTNKDFGTRCEMTNIHTWIPR